MKPKIIIAIGTRPEAIKCAPLIKLVERDTRFDLCVCVTGQHGTMLEQVLQVFDIRPHYHLGLMRPAQTLASLTSAILEAMMPVLEKEVSPNAATVLIVQGDTTTAFVSALAAFYKQGIVIAHLEAGLRTFDKSAPFPEEINRQLIGRVADLHFAPTLQAKVNLLQENVAEERIFITGNTAIDALQLVLKNLNALSPDERKTKINLPASIYALLEEHRQAKNSAKKVILVTGHRRENFGDGFQQICLALQQLSDVEGVEILYPVHLNPNVQKPVYELLSNRPNVHLLEPLDYLSFAYLLQASTLVITDSGGIQEEAPSLGKPVLVMRDVTERPEAVEAGTSLLVGANAERIVAAAKRLLSDEAEYARIAKIHNPFGDGTAAQQVVEILATKFCS
ncbi:MAG: UDP-N-acetylglucosamine 2-epimerase (non-hydrolyzing) [Candidatus Kapaibacterium sp.]|nr:MAG: UDP-N-acetylglucosamine 2-epimerase (non-hydrolyzing) [Candidatus Kapabacteria bacterium]